MPVDERFRVFISYARKDGAELALRLHADLKKEGFEAWLDQQRISGGASWTDTIETALDGAEYLVALLTPGSYTSEICRAEQLRSLRKGKCVIPLLAKSGCDIPLHLETKNYRDFSAESDYDKAFEGLLEDLKARSGVELRQEFRETYVTAPPLPMNFVERPRELEGLRAALINDNGGRHIALTALRGMGGIGKTVLAQALCHDEVVQQAFPDGVIWVSVGKESTYDLVTRLREVASGLGDDPKNYENELRAINCYRNTIRKKAALIVVDDIWNVKDIEPFRAESPRSRLLFTTRDATIAAAVGAREHLADLLTEEQSREVLARWSDTEVAKLPPVAIELIDECDRLPLALSMVGAMLRHKPPALWNAALEYLRKAALEKINAQFPDYPHKNLLRSIQVSVDALDPTTKARYFSLAVLLEEMPATPPVQRCIWGLDEHEAAETAATFVNMSLAQREGQDEGIRLHGLQLDYVRALYSDKEVLDLIHGAVRLSSNVVAEQFASQMVGRLLPYCDLHAISEFSTKVAKGARAPWLRPLHPVLHPPGTALTRNLTGHRRRVNGVALSGDGRIAVSSSDDQTVKVWEMSSGRELRTLTGHSE